MLSAINCSRKRKEPTRRSERIKKFKPNSLTFQKRSLLPSFQNYQLNLFSDSGFDPRTNEFVSVPMPQIKKDKAVLGLGVLDGCLSLAVWTHCRRHNETEVEVFVMNIYGDQASWTSFFIISNVQHLSGWRVWVPLCFTKNGQEIMPPETQFGLRISVYNREFNFYNDNPLRIENCIFDINATTFVESLTEPPNNNWEEEEEHAENFLSGVTTKWKREKGKVAFERINS